MSDDEQWDQAEATIRGWRIQGFTYNQFLEALADQFEPPILKRLQASAEIANSPAWKGWAINHNGRWGPFLDGIEHIFELYDAGNTVDEAMDKMGIPRRDQGDIDTIDELEKQDKKKNKILEAGIRENADQKRRIDELEKLVKRQRALLAHRQEESHRSRARTVIDQLRITRP